MSSLNLRTYFLRTLIAALSVSALLGIVIFLIGNFGETESRILGTTLCIGAYSLTGLCSATLLERNRFRGLAVAGIVVSVLGFVVTTLMIWELVKFKDLWKAMLILMILAFSLAHSALLLLINARTKAVANILLATLVCIGIVSVLLIILTVVEVPEYPEVFFRILGVFAILDVLGTIVTPIMNRLEIGEGLLDAKKDTAHIQAAHIVLETNRPEALQTFIENTFSVKIPFQTIDRSFSTTIFEIPFLIQKTAPHQSRRPVTIQLKTSHPSYFYDRALENGATPSDHTLSEYAAIDPVGNLWVFV